MPFKRTLRLPAVLFFSSNVFVLVLTFTLGQVLSETNTLVCVHLTVSDLWVSQICRWGGCQQEKLFLFWSSQSFSISLPPHSAQWIWFLKAKASLPVHDPQFTDWFFLVFLSPALFPLLPLLVFQGSVFSSSLSSVNCFTTSSHSFQMSASSSLSPHLSQNQRRISWHLGNQHQD